MQKVRAAPSSRRQEKKPLRSTPYQKPDGNQQNILPTQTKTEPYKKEQRILIVGDGNMSFGFALCKHRLKGECSNVIVTTYDSSNELKKYPEAQGYGDGLKELGATVLHDVDAQDLQNTLTPKLKSEQKSWKFDIIIFMFPLVHPATTRTDFEARPDPIVENKMLILKFLKSAKQLLSEKGEIHITSKEVKPYSWWQIHRLSDGLEPLYFVERREFDASLFPGYQTRKPVNLHKDRVESFPLTECVTFVFALNNILCSTTLPDKTATFYCAACDRAIVREEDYEQHQKGRIHKALANIYVKWQELLASTNLDIKS
eukprot:m.66043 g.66043  ORF g.66043 m.66043 type:complete len:315 (-) comp11780_c0_seq2:49-993(-)